MLTNRVQTNQVIAAYANVLFDAAQAGGVVDTVGIELAEAARTLRSHAELRDTLVGGPAPAEVRGSVAREVFGSMTPALVATFGVMAERGDFGLLSSVVDAYAVVADERRNVTAIDVVTAVELTDQLRTAIADKFSADLGTGVVLREKVDPSIIGGIIISAHGRRLDASIASQLATARATLSTVATGGDA